MARYLLDLENLPKAKKEVILQITSPLSEQGKTAFVRSLVFLGFAEMKKSGIDVDNANIGKSKHAKPERVRVTLTNTKVSKFLEKYPNSISKRSCVYALLYLGINCFIEYMQTLEKSKNEKEITRIEESLFLCGLGEYFNSELKFSITSTPIKTSSQPTSHTSAPETTKSTPESAKQAPQQNALERPKQEAVAKTDATEQQVQSSRTPEKAEVTENPKNNRRSVSLANFSIDGF